MGEKKEQIIVSQVSTATGGPTDSSEEIDEQHNAMPPTLYVKSTVDLNSSSSCNGMNQDPGSGKPGQQPIPPKMESSSSSQYTEYRGSCTCKSGYCAMKGPPSLGTVRRPGCSPDIGNNSIAMCAADEAGVGNRAVVAPHTRVEDATQE